MNSTMSLFMSLYERGENGRPSRSLKPSEQEGEKMCLGFCEREGEGFARLWAKGYRLQVAGGHLAFKELVMEGTLNDSSPSP